jgi:hypothetical protein
MLYLLSIDYAEIFIPAVVSLIIWCFLVRWAVRADSIVKNQQAMIWFLILMAKKQGVTDEDIQKIKDHYKIL